LRPVSPFEGGEPHVLRAGEATGDGDLVGGQAIRPGVADIAFVAFVALDRGEPVGERAGKAVVDC
jgi:hypothetical protein